MKKTEYNMELLRHVFAYLALFSIFVTPLLATMPVNPVEKSMTILFEGSIYDEYGGHVDNYKFELTIHAKYDILDRLEWINIVKDENYQARFDARKNKVFGRHTGVAAQKLLREFCDACAEELDCEYIYIGQIFASRSTQKSYHIKRLRREYWQQTEIGLIHLPVDCVACL